MFNYLEREQKFTSWKHCIRYKRNSINLGNNFTSLCFCWYTSSIDKESGVLGQHTAVSQTSVSKHRWLPRKKHPHMHNTKWQSVFCLQQTNEKTAQLLGTCRSVHSGHFLAVLESREVAGWFGSSSLESQWLEAPMEEQEWLKKKISHLSLSSWNIWTDLHPNMSCSSIMLTNSYYSICW